MSVDSTSLRNKLLASLPPEDLQRMTPHFETVPLPMLRSLYKEGEPIEHVYFIGAGACSLIKTTAEGASAEVALVGNEGVIGSLTYFGERHSFAQAIVQTEGFAVRMPVAPFLAEMDRRGALHETITRFWQALMSQIMQTTACNALHSAEQRCCRWLLMTRDRASSDDLKLTHEFLALMLGVRRPTVTLVMGELQRQGAIENHRRTIRIRDRSHLQTVSCECYEAVKMTFRQYLPELHRYTAAERA